MKTEITEQERQVIEEAAIDYADRIFEERLGNIGAKNGFKAGADFALSELRKPSEPETSNDFMQNLQEYLENTPREDILKAWDSTKRFDVEPIGRTDEELVQKIAGLIENDLLDTYVPRWEDEDGDPVQLKDLLSNTNTIDSGIEIIHDIVYNMNSIEEIAALIPSSISREYDVNTELLEALKLANRILHGSLEAVDELNKSKAIDIAITNAEKQMSHE